MRAYLLTGCVTIAVSASLSVAACGSAGDGSRIGGGGGADSGAGNGGSGADGTGGGFGGNLTDGSAGMGPDGSCGESVIESTEKVVSILLVIDKSGSMNELVEDDGPTRWTAVKSAVDTALNETKSAIDFGLDLYPVGPGDNACSVPSDPAMAVPIEDGMTGVGKVLTALNGATPGGQTPTAAALARAHHYFTTGAGAALEGDKYVLLATDGGPNCNSALTCGPATCTPNMEMKCPVANCCASDNLSCLDADATLGEIQGLADAGVRTFVVGIPGAEAFADSLNQFAVAGLEPRDGDTKYYAVEDAEDLTTTFQSITKNLIKTCELKLTSEPEDRRRLNVYIDGELIPRSETTWRLDETTSPPTIELLDATCDKVERDGAERVQIIFGCPTVVVQ